MEEDAVDEEEESEDEEVEVVQAPPAKKDNAASKRAAKPPPSGYICNACKLPNHWIFDCEVYLATKAKAPAKKKVFADEVSRRAMPMAHCRQLTAHSPLLMKPPPAAPPPAARHYNRTRMRRRRRSKRRRRMARRRLHRTARQTGPPAARGRCSLRACLSI